MSFLASFLGAAAANIAVGVLLVIIGGSAPEYHPEDKE